MILLVIPYMVSRRRSYVLSREEVRHPTLSADRGKLLGQRPVAATSDGHPGATGPSPGLGSDRRTAGVRGPFRPEHDGHRRPSPGADHHRGHPAYRRPTGLRPYLARERLPEDHPFPSE